MTLKAISNALGSASGVLPPSSGGTGTSTTFTQGSVIFAGVSGIYSQDNAKFFWDDTNFRLGIGLANPTAALSFASGTTAAGGIAFGTDVTLFRASANQLNLLGSNLYISGGLSLGAGVTIAGPGADGRLRLSNNAGTDFSLLQFGGTTSSFPAIKRTSASLSIRLADDSADAAINSGTITSSGNIFAQTGLAVPYILGASAVPASVTGTLTETTLATITVPSGALGNNGWIEIETIWTITNSVNTKNLLVRFGGTGGTAFTNTGLTTSLGVRQYTSIQNRNSASSQVGWGQTVNGWGTTTGANQTAALNTGIAQDISIRASLTNTGETITLEAYKVKLHYVA